MKNLLWTNLKRRRSFIAQDVAYSHQSYSTHQISTLLVDVCDDINASRSTRLPGTGDSDLIMSHVTPSSPGAVAWLVSTFLSSREVITGISSHRSPQRLSTLSSVGGLLNWQQQLYTVIECLSYSMDVVGWGCEYWLFPGSIWVIGHLHASDCAFLVYT